MDWQPDQNVLHQVAAMFANFMVFDNQVQAQALKDLQEAEKMPDFVNYAVFIFAKMEGADQRTLQIRARAGVILKNNVVRHFNRISPPVLHFTMAEILRCIGDSAGSIRNIAGAAIAEVVKRKGLEAWPGVMEALVAALSSSDANVVQGTLSTLSKVCEDCAGMLCSVNQQMQPKYGPVLDALVEKFLVIAQAPEESSRTNALGCLNSLLRYMPPALSSRFPAFLQVVFGLAADPSAEVKAKVLMAMTLLVQSSSGVDSSGYGAPSPTPEDLRRTQFLAPHFEQVVQFVLFCSGDENEDVAKQACEFWISALSSRLEMNGKHVLQIIEPCLPKLTQILVKHVIYSEEEKFEIEREDEAPDNEQNIKPRNFGGRDEEDEFSNGEEQGGWNLRKLAALSIDMLAGAYQDHLLSCILPVIEQLMKPGVAWDATEAAIMALGAVADGCSTGMEKHLIGLIPYLVGQLGNPHPLVRNISCWSLSRYAPWITEQDHQAVVVPVLEGVLRCVLDQNKRVQTAGCSAFSVIAEDSRTDLSRYIKPIMETFSKALSLYGPKNTLVLHDAIASFTESCAWAIRHTPEYVNIYAENVLGQMAERWMKTSDDDMVLCSISECLGVVIRTVGSGFSNYAPVIFKRCLSILDSNLLLMANAQSPSDMPDANFSICILYFLADMATCIKEEFRNLVASSNLLGQMYKLMKCRSMYIRKAAFALLGDITPFIADLIVQPLPQLIEVTLQFTRPVVNEGDVANATWSLGVLLSAAGPNSKPYLAAAHNALMNILVLDRPSRILAANAAVSMARIAMLDASVLAPHLEKYIPNWCHASMQPRVEAARVLACRGVVAALQVKPEVVFNEKLYWVCKMIAMVTPPKDLAEVCHHLMMSYKQSLGPDNWGELVGQMDDGVKNALKQKYNVM